MQQYMWLIPVVFLVIGGGLVFILSRYGGGMRKVNSQDQEPKEIELTKRFCMGRYLCGLPGANASAPLVFCGVTEESFLFSKGSRGVEIGRIHRGSINNILVAGKSQAAQQLTAEEQSSFGEVLTSIKNNSQCLVLSWENSDKKKHHSLFEPLEQDSAEIAAQALKKWMEPKQMKESVAKAL